MAIAAMLGNFISKIFQESFCPSRLSFLLLLPENHASFDIFCWNNSDKQQLRGSETNRWQNSILISKTTYLLGKQFMK